MDGGLDMEMEVEVEMEMDTGMKMEMDWVFEMQMERVLVLQMYSGWWLTWRRRWIAVGGVNGCDDGYGLEVR